MTAIKTIHEVSINFIPTVGDVKNFITVRERLNADLTESAEQTRPYSKAELAHLCVAAWICKRNEVEPIDFLTRLSRKHRKMESGKIVPPHQLSTSYAEQTAIELRRKEPNPYEDALLNRDIPLNEDSRFMSTYELVENNVFISDCEFTKVEIIYSAERMVQMDGVLNDTFKNYIKRHGISLG